MAYDINTGIQPINFSGALQQGLQSGQQFSEGLLKQRQQGQLNDLQQQYMSAPETDKRGLLQKIAVLNPEHAKGILAVSQAANGSSAFEGTSMEAQRANIQYQRYIAAGLSPNEARLRASNDVAATSMTYDRAGNPVYGQPLPAVGVLGGAAAQQDRLSSTPISSPSQSSFGVSPQVNPQQGNLGGKMSDAEKAVQEMDPTDIYNQAHDESSDSEKQLAMQFVNTPPEQQASWYKQNMAGLEGAPPELTPEAKAHIEGVASIAQQTANVMPNDRAVLPPLAASNPYINSPVTQIAAAEQIKKNEELQAPTRAKIEEKVLNSTEALSRIKSIDASFNPDYLQLGTRINFAADNIKDKLGVSLSKPETEKLQKYSSFKRAAIDNMNRLLNELSGAAVSPSEGDRLKASQPDAGTGVFDGDGPIIFKQKMNDVNQQMRNAVLRQNYALKHGMNPLKSNIELQDVPALIEKRGHEIETEIKREFPNNKQEFYDMQTKMELGQEFGMQ